MTLLTWKRNSTWMAVGILAVQLMGSACSAPAQGLGPGVKVHATLYSTIGFQNGELGWVGSAIVTVGDAAPVPATYFCPLAPAKFKPSGELVGTEPAPTPTLTAH